MFAGRQHDTDLRIGQRPRALLAGGDAQAGSIGMSLEAVRLVSKRGGKSGEWVREGEREPG